MFSILFLSRNTRNFIIYFPQITQITQISSFLIFRYAQDFVLFRYKKLTYNKIRSLAAQEVALRMTQIASGIYIELMSIYNAKLEKKLEY